jgi:hypothetical protein
MKKLYLHIGAANTGADILQRNLYRNRKSLMQAGIYYPSEPYGMESSSSVHGNGIALEKVIFSESYDERRLMALLGDYFRASRGRDILFSGEKLEKLPVNAAKDLKHIANSYNFEVHIVYYVRAIVDQIVSLYYKAVMTRGLSRSMKEMFDLYISYEGHYRFVQSVAKFSDIFGRDALVVKNMDGVKGFLFEDFVETVLGLDRESVAQLDVEYPRESRIPTPYELEMVRHINGVMGDSPASSLLAEALLVENPAESDRMKIDAESARRLVEKFDGDTKLLNRFISVGEKRLETIESVEIVEEMERFALRPFQSASLAMIMHMAKEIRKGVR